MYLRETGGLTYIPWLFIAKDFWIVYTKYFKLSKSGATNSLKFSFVFDLICHTCAKWCYDIVICSVP